jgi:threonine aldolase
MAARSKGPDGDAGLEALSGSCTRHLRGDGPATAADLLATIPADTAMDRYGDGGVVAELEAEVAALLGKEAALFVPTGTMAQQATLRIHADRRPTRTVAFHPACHLDTREERAYERIHGLWGHPVGSRLEPLTAAALAGVREPVAALVVELPQRDLGGTLPTWRELVAQTAWARRAGAAVHLDGARLWEAAPYYAKAGRSTAEVAGLFDTVYVSFYKGLGGISGCCVAGDAATIGELSLWRTRHGGRTFMMWPYAASALTVLRRRVPAMASYQRHAVAIAEALRDLPGVEVLPDPVVTPMMHLRLAVTAEALRANVVELATTERIMTFPRVFVSEGRRLQRVEFQAGAATASFTAAEVRELVARLVA